MELGDIQARLRPHASALIPGAVAVALMLVWAVHNGGYDTDTWYWGALVLLATLAGVLIARGGATISVSRASQAALAAFALYVAWSYVSISWAQSPGDALQGSNRALLYLLVFALLLALPWTAEGALMALLVFVFGVGVIAFVLLYRLASQDHVGQLVIEGRLAAPTGYFNGTAALFTLDALAATALAARRELPVLLRGGLLAIACAGLQLALIVQSRGWLFTLPLIIAVSIATVPDRLRVVAAAIVPIAAALAPLPRLLDVYKSAAGEPLTHAAGRAGQIGLISSGAAFVAGSVLAWGDRRLGPRDIGRARRRVLGGAVAAAAVVAVCAGGVVATHGHPFRFISREWRGLSQPTSLTSSSHFADVGSGRYDFWHVSLDIVLVHPIGGLGQDNFADYYLPRRRTQEEPAWTHSLEMRLLAHTGVVGFALFATFLVAAIAAAVRARRSVGLARAVAGAALLPLVVWLIYGSVDWFWEIPALSGPALGFLAIAMALGRPRHSQPPARSSRRRLPRFVAIVLGTTALLVVLVVLALPYLAVREASVASDIGLRNPTAALRGLDRAADLNPLSPDPGRLAGTIALRSGRWRKAEQSFRQAISREPGGWYGWLGDGLAASALGNTARARHDFVVAASINRLQPAIKQALARVDGPHPLSPGQAFRLLVPEH